MKTAFIVLISLLGGMAVAIMFPRRDTSNPHEDVVTIGDTAFPVRILVDHGVSYRFITYDRCAIILPPLPQKVEKP